MKLEILLPDLKLCSMSELVHKIPIKHAITFSNELAEYYDSRLDINSIYQYYGVLIRTRVGHQFQISCLLPTHGSRDEHSSARYYTADRNTGEVRPRIYCWKCGKMNTLFWYLYRIEEGLGRKYGEMFEFIYQTFGIEFPRDLFLNFDPEVKYTLKQDSLDELTYGRMRSNNIRMMKIVNPVQYLQELKNLLSGA